MIPTQENEKILKHISIKMFLNLWLVGILEHWVTTKTKKKKHKKKNGYYLRTTSHLHKSETDESKITML